METEIRSTAPLEFEFYEQVDKLRGHGGFVLAFSDGVFNPAFWLPRQEAEQLLFQMADVLGFGLVY